MAQVTYDAYLETFPNGTVQAWVLDLPGCFAFGVSAEEAVARLRVAVPDYYRWLSLQDAETPTMSGDIAITVREQVAVTEHGLHQVRAFFTPDAAPLADEDLDWGLALMSYAHTDLMRLAQRLDDAALDWLPDSQSRSARQIIDHLAQMEVWLATRLDPSQQVPIITELPAPSVERYNQIHEQAMLRLSDAPPEQRATVTESNTERWSMRKILRRSITHEREHTEDIAILLQHRAAGS
jgi:hypothetical protein